MCQSAKYIGIKKQPMKNNSQRYIISTRNQLIMDLAKRINALALRKNNKEDTHKKKIMKNFIFFYKELYLL